MTKIYLTAFFCALFFFTQSQPTFIRQLSATGIKNVLATNDGGYIVTTNYNILKYNSNDSLLWNQTVTDSSTMYFQQAIVLKNGGYAFLCKSGKAPHTDAEVVKLDNALNVTWRKRLFGDIPLSIAEDWSGNLLISAMNEDETDHSVLIKLDKDGNGVWLRNLSNTISNAFIGCIKISADKKYITSGENNDGSSIVIFDSAGNQLVTNSYEQNSPLVTKAELFNNGDILYLPATEDGIARMNATGNITWKKTLTTTNSKIYFQSASINNSSILLGGYKTGQFDVDSVLVLGAFSSAGNCVWLKQVNMPSRTSAISIAKLKNGSYIIAAAGNPYFQYNHGASYLIKLTSTGNTCNSSKLSFTETDALFPARQSRNYTADNVNFQNPKMILQTVYNATSNTICSSKSLQNENIIAVDKNVKTFNLSVSPNPVQNVAVINMHADKTTKVSIVITDINGRIVIMKNATVIAGNNHQQIDLSNIYAGSYRVTVKNDDVSESVNIIKY